MPNESTSNGAFIESLKRNNKKIREDRADAITEDAQLLFKREIEDLAIDIKKLKREQENMLDLSPSDANSLVLASDFNAKNYVAKEMELGVSIHNMEKKLEIAQSRYKYLFGQAAV